MKYQKNHGRWLEYIYLVLIAVTFFVLYTTRAKSQYLKEQKKINEEPN